MFTLFVGSAVILGMLAFFKKENVDSEEWADRREYLKFFQDLESWKNPVRWN